METAQPIQLTRQQVQSRVFHLIAKDLKVNPLHVHPNSNLTDDLGMNENNGLALLMDIQTQFDGVAIFERGSLQFASRAKEYEEKTKNTSSYNTPGWAVDYICKELGIAQ